MSFLVVWDTESGRRSCAAQTAATAPGGSRQACAPLPLARLKDLRRVVTWSERRPQVVALRQSSSWLRPVLAVVELEGDTTMTGALLRGSWEAPPDELTTMSLTTMSLTAVLPSRRPGSQCGSAGQIVHPRIDPRAIFNRGRDVLSAGGHCPRRVPAEVIGGAA